MKRPVYFLAILSILVFACTISTPATVVPPPSDTPAAAESPTAPVPPTATLPPTASVPTAPPTNANCNALALYLDPALASGYKCQTVPEAGDVSLPTFAVNPQYTQITLDGYPLSDRLMTPQIDVFPVDRYIQLLPDQLTHTVNFLKALIGGADSSGSELPVLPIQGAQQLFHAMYQVIPFASGSGARYITEYAQFVDPINNHDMFYTYQGLTSDGKYWISVLLPISNPILPADGNTPPNGQSPDQFTNDYPTYLVDITAKLNAQPLESYSPSITMLDALVASIKIRP